MNKLEQFLYGFRFLYRSFLDWKDLLNDTCNGEPFDKSEDYQDSVEFNHWYFFIGL
ncbi:MAG: hypothetical protein R3321_03750 [Nitrososphaeraceae archaeon]|nr:hypothetical protein [Nitrososphaeraceae archaeon]